MPSDISLAVGDGARRMTYVELAAALRAEAERWRHMGWLHRIFSRIR
jgi:hypothetical protein